MLRKQAVIVVLALFTLVACSGCTYLRNRGNDASDVFEIGLTVTPRLKPVFALYWNPFNVLSFGYVDAEDLTLLGWSDRQLGAMDINFKAWGALAWGSQQLGIGREEAVAEAGMPLGWSVTEPGKTYTVGFAGAFSGDDTPPGRTFGECPKLLHLGWIGLYANCSVVDFADFILGWTTLDIGHDDAPAHATRPGGGMVAAMGQPARATPEDRR